MNADYVVVDANIAFKCLCSNAGDLRERLRPRRHPVFFSPRFLLVEIFKHKERLVKLTGLREEDLLGALHTLITRVEFVNESNIPIGTWVEAYRLCRAVDEKDTPYIALTLHLDGVFWTQDDALKEALRARGFDRFFEP